MKRTLWIKGLIAIACVWAIAWAVTSFASDKKATARRFIEVYDDSSFSSESSEEKRRESLDTMAAVLNRMDLREREKLRETGKDGEFFDALTSTEKRYWIEITIEKSMTKMMKALDAMPSEERKKFVGKGLAQLEKGAAKADIDRLREVDPDILDRITEEGLSAYYQDAGADTKMDLAPLMEAMNGVLQGIRGNEWDPNNR